MLEMLLLILLVAPVAYSIVKAFINAKYYYDYDSEKCCYISRVTK